MLTDLFGFFKRNVKNMNRKQVEKNLKEMKSIVRLLENELQKV